ncbi:ATP-binding protein [Gordonia sp. zg691]|uniref:ATP-binding protein n=1 Tax=Gordonia jinghuaiqii TaxID=2758710 RepID=UPI001662659F|nr:ATP-binding protein [Gordonia jinghuaiqii]MBD0861530.1 ATP-binding protein [Gordonia jinghuaiqii]
MGGVDAAAGFAYQHAQAVLCVLDLATNPDLGFVRVEATNDVVDVETYTNEGTLHAAVQCKRRDRQYTWGEKELVAELGRWSNLGSDYAGATYTFQTDGRLGPSGRAVKDALDTLRAGDDEALKTFAVRNGVTLDADVCSRATIEPDTPGFDSLIETAADRTTALLPTVTGEREAEERSAGVVLEVLRWVVARSGQPDSADRTITRQEVLELLAHEAEYVATTTWSADLKQALVKAIQGKDPLAFTLNCVDDSSQSSQTPSATVTPEQLLTPVSNDCVPILSGPSGSGKSTKLAHLQTASRSGRVVLLVEAENYIPKRLGSLVARGINAVQFVGAYSATGLEALKDPEVTVMIDGVSEIPRADRDALSVELRQLLGAESHARIVLSGRDRAVLTSVLPRSTKKLPLVVQPLSRDRRIKLLSALAGSTTADDRTVNTLVAQVEKALGDAVDNPHLFVMGVSLLLAGNEFSNPASMYQSYVRDLADKNGYVEVATLEAGLGIAYASLARTGRRYCDSHEWTSELKRAAEDLEGCGHEITTRDLREFGFESGLVHRGAGDIVRALHDSVADYLTATAYWRRLADVPRYLTEDDRVRIEFYTELAGIDQELATVVVRDLPFLLPKLSLHEAASNDPSTWHIATVRYVEGLWPVGCRSPRVAYWISNDKVMVTVDGSGEGWLGVSTIDEAGVDGLTFEAERGPLSVAIRIWRHRLSEVLGQSKRDRAPVPATETETLAMLEQYADTLEQTTQERIEQVAPPHQAAPLVNTLGPTKIQFLLAEDEAASQRDRPVWFRYTETPSTTVVVRGTTASSYHEWSGYGSVDSFTQKDAMAEADKRIVRALNRIAGIQWL